MLTASTNGIPGIFFIIFYNLLILVFYGGIVYFFVLAVKALRKYLKSEEVRKETKAIRKSLGEALKEHRGPVQNDPGICGRAPGCQPSGREQMGKRHL